ncbi:Protein GIR2 [Spathaspora sp. JA1]|nr:Protein GIR2 [Spathaspora sp. JA1]
MDPAEEQQQELEVLESIYPDELTVISPTHFVIRVQLDTPSQRKHFLDLIVRYPPTYPEVIPNLDLEIPEDISDDEADEDDDEEDEDDDDVKAMKLALNMAEIIEFTRNELALLLTKLNEEAELNIGMPSVFALTTQLKDEAEALFNQILETRQKEYEREREEREREEQKKFIGTKVTKESFLEWRAKFRSEMKFDEIDKQRFQQMHQGKLTGREIFEKGLAGAEDEDEDEVTAVEGVKKLAI